jgi:hypothetical protein
LHRLLTFANASGVEMPEARRELAPPKMFPRTEGQAKLMVFFVIAAVIIGIAVLIYFGVKPHSVVSE